jgi:hypothetical protein
VGGGRLFDFRIYVDRDGEFLENNAQEMSADQL